MLYKSAISKAYFSRPSRLANGLGSSMVSTLLGDVAGRWMCVVEIERRDGRFTLILDADWAEMGLQLGSLPDDEDHVPFDVELPRPALKAVISGWPDDWDQTVNPKMGVHISDDMIPHISVDDTDSLTSPGTRPGS